MRSVQKQAGSASMVVKVGDRGRLVLPSAVRARLNLRAGAQLLVSIDADESLRLRPYRAIAEQGRGMLSHLASDGSAVDDLLAERRAEAAREQTD